MQIDPRRLAVLRAVADAGGILAAAAVLHLTPSAVSQHVARLEAETGVTLLDRSRLGGRRAVGLTPAGRLLAEHAGRLAEVLAEAERDLTALTGQVTGSVTVAGFPTAIRHLIVPASVAVAATSPSVQVRVRQLEPGPGVAALRAGEIDLLVSEADAADAEADPPGLRSVRLCDDPYLVVAPASWGALSGIEALLSRAWVDGPRGSAVRQVLDRLAGRYDSLLDRPHECLEFPPALAIVAAGLAATVVPELALPADDATFQVIAAPAVGARRLVLVHRRGRHEQSPAVRLVAEAVRAQATSGRVSEYASRYGRTA